MRNCRFGKNLQVFQGHYHGSAFGSTFWQKVAKGASFREKASKIFNLAKTCNFSEQTSMFRRLGQPFGKKLQKVPHVAKKDAKSSIWPRLATILSRLPPFGVSVNFLTKSCKKYLISRQSMKNRRFGPNLVLFCRQYRVSAFRSTFRQKAAKSALFLEKA